jgi:hypothetical protein
MKRGTEKAGRLGPFSNRNPGIVPIKSSSRHCRSSRISALEQWFAALKVRDLNVFVEESARANDALAFRVPCHLFVESQAPTGTIMTVVINFEFQDCAHSAISARSRKPDTESLGIDSNSALAPSRLQTGVLPYLTTYFGPRTECAGLDGVICRTTRKSYNIRTAASFCLMVGLDPG